MLSHNFPPSIVVVCNTLIVQLSLSIQQVNSFTSKERPEGLFLGFFAFSLNYLRYVFISVCLSSRHSTPNSFHKNNHHSSCFETECNSHSFHTKIQYILSWIFTSPCPCVSSLVVGYCLFLFLYLFLSCRHHRHLLSTALRVVSLCHRRRQWCCFSNTTPIEETTTAKHSHNHKSHKCSLHSSTTFQKKEHFLIGNSFGGTSIRHNQTSQSNMYRHIYFILIPRQQQLHHPPQPSTVTNLKYPSKWLVYGFQTMRAFVL